MKKILDLGMKSSQLSVLLCTLAISTTASAQSFTGVKWSLDKSNTPSLNKSGLGIAPNAAGATNNKKPYTFRINSNSTDSIQRQEFKFERRTGFNWMSGKFKLNESLTKFDKISIAQTQDYNTSNSKVFSIYQIRKSGDGWVFGVQGDTVEAKNSYSQFENVEINLGEEYSISIKTNSQGLESYERARLYDGSGKKIWDQTIIGGGASEQYKKVGLSRLEGGNGPVQITWRDLKFYNGKK